MASIPTPLTNPPGPGFRSASLTSQTFGMSHKLNGAAIVTVKTVGQSWRITVEYNTMTQDQHAPLDAFLTSLDGNMEPFQIMLPQYRNPVGGAVGATTGVTPAATYSNTTDIRLTNFTNITNHERITANSLIKFDNQPKVYRIKSISMDGTSADIVLNTPLYSSISTTDTVQFSDIEFTVKLTESPTILTNSDYLVEGYSLSMEETIL